MHDGASSISGEADFKKIVDAMPGLLSRLRSCSARGRLDPEIGAVPGIYTFWEGQRPLYVGRSNTIKQRIHLHTRPSSSHNSATLAFLLAKKEMASRRLTTAAKTRKALETDPIFKPLFDDAKARVANMTVRFVEVPDPATQTIFEVYAAMILKTPYNDFDNH